MTANEDVIMVLNPFTKKLVNVKPLFDLDGDFEESYNRVDNAIYTIVVRCNFDEYGNAVKDALWGLYQIRDMFKDLMECEISMPEKKGSSK